MKKKATIGAEPIKHVFGNTEEHPDNIHLPAEPDTADPISSGAHQSQNEQTQEKDDQAH
jgi:hypothetical protein